MNEDQRRLVCLLVDGECSGDELSRALDELLADPGLKQTWERYHLAGQVLRREAVYRPERVPAARTRRPVATTSAPPARTGSRRRQANAAVPLASALAAGLAAVAVFFIFDDLGTSSLSTATYDAAPPTATFAQRWQRQDPLLRAKLDQMMVDHRERAAATGFVGVASYAAAVGFEGPP